MGRDINFEGKLYSFPDDATDNEIGQALGDLSKPAAPGFFSRAGSAIGRAAGAVTNFFGAMPSPEAPDLTAPIPAQPAAPTPLPKIPAPSFEEFPDIGTAPLGRCRRLWRR